MNIITIKTNFKKNSDLTINPQLAYELGIDKKKRACIHFGNLKSFITIVTDEDMDESSIALSNKLMLELHLPEYPTYEVIVRDNEISLGPFIGLLISSENKTITVERLRSLMVYVREYSMIHGAVVFFALDKVDTAGRLVEGYCYNPRENRMEKGIFPYPSAIYRTIGLNDWWKNHFLSVIGDKFFNNQYFNKWEMYQWFSKDKEIEPHLPKTVLYNSCEDVLEMLKSYGKIYIKPVAGLGGKGIIQAKLENNKYIFLYRFKGENYTDIFDHFDDACEYINKRLLGGRYIIQQGIDLYEIRGGIIDFRCIMQKNQSNIWVCKSIIGRVGVKNSIVSNISSGGRAFKLSELNIKGPQLGSLVEQKDKIEELALKACATLDEFGINCGTLGIDIGYGKDGRLWLFEINNRDPDPTIALNVNDVKLYYNLKAGPLLYAKYLAGFGG